MPAITPSLWFDSNLEEAAEFYTSIFPNSSIEEVSRYTDAGPGTPGEVVSGTFVLDGTRFIGINGGPAFQFSEAVSFMVGCKDQAEVDYYWDRLVERGEDQRPGSGPFGRRHQGDARHAQDCHRRVGRGGRQRVKKD